MARYTTTHMTAVDEVYMLERPDDPLAQWCVICGYVPDPAIPISNTTRDLWAAPCVDLSIDQYRRITEEDVFWASVCGADLDRLRDNATIPLPDTLYFESDS